MFLSVFVVCVWLRFVLLLILLRLPPFCLWPDSAAGLRNPIARHPTGVPNRIARCTVCRCARDTAIAAAPVRCRARLLLLLLLPPTILLVLLLLLVLRPPLLIPLLLLLILLLLLLPLLLPLRLLLPLSTSTSTTTSATSASTPAATTSAATAAAATHTTDYYYSRYRRHHKCGRPLLLPLLLLLLLPHRCGHYHELPQLMEYVLSACRRALARNRPTRHRHLWFSGLGFTPPTRVSPTFLANCTIELRQVGAAARGQARPAARASERSSRHGCPQAGRVASRGSSNTTSLPRVR
jgi:hypothetical protein